MFPLNCYIIILKHTARLLACKRSENYVYPGKMVCPPVIKQNESQKLIESYSKSCQSFFFFKDHIYKLYFKVVYSILKLCSGFNICLEKSVSNLRTN